MTLVKVYLCRFDIGRGDVGTDSCSDQVAIRYAMSAISLFPLKKPLRPRAKPILETANLGFSSLYETGIINKSDTEMGIKIDEREF